MVVNADESPHDALLLDPSTRVTCPKCEHEFSLEEGFAKKSLEAIESARADALASVKRSVAPRSANRDGVNRDPVGELIFAQVAGGELQEGRDALCVRGDEFETVQVEKKFRDDQAGTLVAVQERVITGESKSVACGQTRD